MSLKSYIQTNNTNALIGEDSNSNAVLQVTSAINSQPIDVLIEKSVWLEEHDASVNSCKYYNIVRTVNGKVIAFWGRIFKSGPQEPKFGEIKNSSFSRLLDAKTQKGNYKIYYEYELQMTVTNYSEPRFNVALKGSRKNFYRPSGFQPSVTSPAPVSPIVVSPTAVPEPDALDAAIEDIKRMKAERDQIEKEAAELAKQEAAELEEKRKVEEIERLCPKLSDQQKIILSKLEVLYNFSETIESRINELDGKLGRNGFIWTVEKSAESAHDASQIHFEVGKIIETLKTQFVVKREDLILCNQYNIKLNEINEIYKRCIV